MPFRNIIIESPSKISVEDCQLIIETDKKHSIAIEDITAVLLESRQSKITTAALSSLGQSGCTVFICDEKHMPCAVLTPFSQHSRQLGAVKSQLNAGLPLNKRLWQSSVRAKIKNQGRCLALLGKEAESQHLFDMAKQVKSGDSGNIEAVAAAYYFTKLFGGTFTRTHDNGVNAGLNYGYAIIRGAIARNLAIYGFIPSLGIHHHSELNAFNLADDLIEPFRPVVDLLVASAFTPEKELTPERKRLLFNVLNLDILSGDQHYSVAYAIERLVQSLARAYHTSTASLCLPELLALKQHSYE